MRKLLIMSSFFSGKNKSIFKVFRRICMSLSLILMLCFTIINPIAVKVTESKLCNIAYSANLPSLKEIVKTLFNKKEPQAKKLEKTQVYLGGYPLGFTFNCDGVLVVAISNDSAEGLEEGDVIKKIGQYNVNSESTIAEVLNDKIKSSERIDLTITRNGVEGKASIKPILDNSIGRYKLGIWIRDDAAGVGTITYIRKDNARFGALGHPVCDIDTGTMMPVSTGNIYKCNIVGLKRGEKGTAGELKGLFLRNGSVFGSLDKNSSKGVFGTFSDKHIDFVSGETVEVADRSEIKSGKATIRCTIDGYTPQEYEIEIVKAYLKSTNDTKSMFIRVTDKRLIEQTGGIVQGMSGSPIIQNGKLVGAVTHVFVSDPTKGYGIFADLMINE